MAAKPAFAKAALVPRMPPPIAFADQLDNLAGPLFGSSLFPYLAFLYFICQDVNKLSPVAKAGFVSLLAFVFATIVTSIIAVKVYGTTLANVDWLHAGAEQLLTLTNIVEVLGLKLTLDAFISNAPVDPDAPLTAPKLAGTTAAGTVAITALVASITTGGLVDHSPFLGGIGNLPEGVWGLGFVEPANALSLPTWVIHVSSLLEWLVAMGLVWRIGLVTGNEKWKGLTWAMIPSHSSGICACVYHLFYNAESLTFVVLLQAALTLLGNCTLAFAAGRLAYSNGWRPPLISEGTAPADPPTAAPVLVDGSAGDTSALLTIAALSVGLSYFIKYGETLAPIFMEAPAWAPALLIGGFTCLNAWKWQQRSQAGDDFSGLI